METKEKTHIENFLNIVNPTKTTTSQTRKKEHKKILISIMLFLSVFSHN